MLKLTHKMRVTQNVMTFLKNVPSIFLSIFKFYIMISNKKTLFVFRRDLRVLDNIGLIYALKESQYVIPAFIFDPRQVDKSNFYRSDNAIQFMLTCLEDL